MLRFVLAAAVLFCFAGVSNATDKVLVVKNGCQHVQIVKQHAVQNVVKVVKVQDPCGVYGSCLNDVYGSAFGGYGAFGSNVYGSQFADVVFIDGKFVRVFNPFQLRVNFFPVGSAGY